MERPEEKIRCILHGSFRKHFELIQEIHDIFIAANIEVIAPKKSELISIENGFALLEGEKNQDPRLIELLYLHNLKRLGPSGFSYFVNPEGYIGKSASYELGIAQISNTRCFFYSELDDHPAYVHKNSTWSPHSLAEYIYEHKTLPAPQVKRNEKALHNLWQELMVPGSIVAAGAIIEYEPTKEVLLVKTHKWGDRYSIVGGKVKRNERLSDTLLREVKEETGLNGRVGRHLATFDQIKNSGYYETGMQHIFVDNIVTVESKRIHLNEEAQDYIWIPAKEALRYLDIEPNARHTLELYAKV
ncbi:MAG: NUDIX domain-containing protein [Candidatus Paceibacterota bacterium]